MEKIILENIKRAFSGRLIGKAAMKRAVCEAVAGLPEEMAAYVTRQVWFISSADDAWAFTFRGTDVTGQHLIIFSDELFKQKPQQIRHTILHEIGHVMLGHRNSMGYKQTAAEIRRQEREADSFAEKV